MHYLFLTGNVGSQPKKHKFATGKEVLEFSVAETVHEKDGSKTTIWHDVKAWGNLTKIKVDKGSFVCITGKIRYHKFTDKEGNNVTRSYILADKIFPIQKQEDSFYGITESEQIPANPFI